MPVKMTEEFAALYVVPTPLGNLADLTRRHRFNPTLPGRRSLVQAIPKRALRMAENSCYAGRRMP